MNKVIAKLAIILALTVSTVVVTETPALADYADCPSNVVCTYDFGGGNIGGLGMYYYSFPGGSNPCVNIGGTWNDHISSIYNRTLTGTPRNVYFWTGSNCTGSLDAIGPGFKHNAFYDNQYSSLSW